MNDIFRLLESGHSRAQAVKISNAIINHQHHIADLMSCFFSKEMRICQRASWPVTMIGEQEPDMLLPYMQKMIDHLDHPNHDAVVRNIIRSWQFMEIPEDYIGPIYDKCFTYLTEPQHAVAIRVFSMTTCVNIAQGIPELGPELEAVILEHMDHSTAAFRGRGKKELKRLKQIFLTKGN